MVESSFASLRMTVGHPGQYVGSVHPGSVRQVSMSGQCIQDQYVRSVRRVRTPGQYVKSDDGSGGGRRLVEVLGETAFGGFLVD